MPLNLILLPFSDRLKGTFHPDAFKRDSDGLYYANYKLHGHHATEALGMQQHNLFSAGKGIKEANNFKSWGGGGVLHTVSLGTQNSDCDFEPFQSSGSGAVVLSETGAVIRGHVAGQHQGMVSPASIKFDTSSKHWLPEDAAESMAKYNKTADEVASETFDSYQKVAVDGQQYAMLPKSAAVSQIIDSHGSSRDFYDGMYSKGHHIVDDSLLVPEEHYNELHAPLVDAMRQTESPLVIQVKSSKKPTENIYYTADLVHGAPTVASENSHVVAAEDTARQEAVVAALQRMKLAGKDAEVTMVTGSAGGGAAPEDDA